MILPNVFNFYDCKDYFGEFYRINKEQNPKFSFALIANKLGWPKSYLNDIINDRKPFTVARATNFIQHFEIEGHSAERLIFMALKSSQSGSISEYFSNKLNEAYHLAFKDSAIIPVQDIESNEIHPNNYFISEDADDHELVGCVILKLFVWCDGKIKTKDIPKKLFSFKELNDPEVLKAQILKLEKNKNIKILEFNPEGDTVVEILTNNINFILSYKTLPQTGLYCENMARILRDEKVAGNFNFAFVNIHKKDYQEVETRMNQLRAWFHHLDKKSPADGSPEDYILFQMEINLATSMDFRREGVKNLGDWQK